MTLLIVNLTYCIRSCAKLLLLGKFRKVKLHLHGATLYGNILKISVPYQLSYIPCKCTDKYAIAIPPMSYSGCLYSSSPSTFQWDPLNKDAVSTKSLDYGYFTPLYQPKISWGSLSWIERRSLHTLKFPMNPNIYGTFIFLSLCLCLSPVCVGSRFLFAELFIESLPLPTC